MKTYEEKYKKALEWMREVYPTLQGASKEDAEYYFPELNIGEDDIIKEFIRRELIKLIDSIKSYNNETHEYVHKLYQSVAWLEKQAQKPADKVEHKFNVGDEIKTANEEPLTITKIDEKGYWSEDLFICGFDEECCWDLVEQKPAEWSEEDEYNQAWIVEMLYGLEDEDKEYEKECRKMADWLKSLRPQSHWKPSEEQMIALKCAITTADEKWVCMNTKDLESLYEDLKKLKG